MTFISNQFLNVGAIFVQVELLLGKAYSDWGHISDAIAVYDQLISAHPVDFRGYLAKVNFSSPPQEVESLDILAHKLHVKWCCRELY